MEDGRGGSGGAGVGGRRERRFFSFSSITVQKKSHIISFFLSFFLSFYLFFFKQDNIVLISKHGNKKENAKRIITAS